MNLANKLTIFRMILVPFFVVFLLTDFTAVNEIIALVIFVVATVTDKLDGTIAKKQGTVTNFGKFMDPMADKLLCCSALVCLCALGDVPSWIVLIIIGREFAISGIRQIAADNGVAIAASKWGKAKTVAQMAMIIILLTQRAFAGLTIDTLAVIIMYAALVLTVISLVDYIVKNKSVLTITE
ncbi:MAG: CDP-diacylglycerol--glycerol-3-phosphate 3-phosphatidyltransferase [Ruminococcaceae bacterium]|nr:CDP-diacylglycerol--glycerol-3-phosphate 3-phosphatidyltransferase [Oscillospiraceae bacterium]